jgi:hypothetical protein
MHLSGGTFVDAVRTLIGEDAGTPSRRQPTPEEIKAREARAAERRQAEAEEQARNAASAAKIVARLQPIIGTPGEVYFLGAIVAILTDPITGERTGGITRTFLHQGRKVCRAMTLAGVGRLGIIRLSPDREVETSLHLCEGSSRRCRR